MIYLSSEIAFPPVELARTDGLLAIGGDLTTERLMLAYENGIFPWFSEEDPILWWSPDPRMVLYPEELKVSKSLKKTLRKMPFQVTFDTQFLEVMQRCATAPRKDQPGTWISDQMIQAYLKLHRQGFATSVEIWKEEKLVGGLYGVNLKHKKVFCGESMFTEENDASKVALFMLIEKLKGLNYKLIDCQIYTPHLESLGAREISRTSFLKYLNGEHND